MKVEHVDHMGTDLTVVNAARVSFDKHKDLLDASDEKLIGYLAKHGHWTPFAHPQITLRITVPIFIANQLKRHNVGLVINEVSRRYVDTEPEFYIPDKLGKRAENKKQGSLEGEYITSLQGVVDIAYEQCLHCYNILLQEGVAPEDARMVLPQGMYTSWYWTASLAAYARIYNLRSKPDSQRQNREVAAMISEVIEPLFPISWKALTQ